MAGVVRFRGGKVTATAEIKVVPLANCFQRAGRTTARDISKDIVQEAKRLVPVRTGKLRASIHYNQPRKLSLWTVEGRVTASAPYAAFVHQGTRPHLIVARRAAALRFYWPVTGRVMFLRSVRHPGTGKTPFLRAAALTVAARRR